MQWVKSPAHLCALFLQIEKKFEKNAKLVTEEPEVTDESDSNSDSSTDEQAADEWVTANAGAADLVDSLKLKLAQRHPGLGA